MAEFTGGGIFQQAMELMAGAGGLSLHSGVPMFICLIWNKQCQKKTANTIKYIKTDQGKTHTYATAASK